MTVSDAAKFNQVDSSDISTQVWEEICSYLGEKIKYDRSQVIREKKATYNQTPENILKIKKINNLPKNMVIAGDWTQYKLPCTIEGSILSGKKAVELLIS